MLTSEATEGTAERERVDRAGVASRSEEAILAGLRPRFVEVRGAGGGAVGGARVEVAFLVGLRLRLAGVGLAETEDCM